MKICCYSHSLDKQRIDQLLNDFFVDFHSLNVKKYDDYEKYVKALYSETFDMVIVTMDGANGMEAVIASKEANKKVPVAWFSNDNDFSLQAFRLNVNYFTKKPINENNIKIAFEHCLVNY